MGLQNIQIYNGGSPATLNNFATNATCAGTQTYAPTISAIQTGVIDFGSTRGANWLAALSILMTAAAAAGQTLDIYIGYSSASNGGFPAGLGNSAGAYTGYGTASVASSLPQLEWIGSMILAPVTAVQTSLIGVFTPKLEFGVIVLANNSGGTLGSATGSTNEPPTITLTSIVDEVGV